jgi:hypothetical protein
MADANCGVDNRVKKPRTGQLQAGLKPLPFSAREALDRYQTLICTG